MTTLDFEVYPDEIWELNYIRLDDADGGWYVTLHVALDGGVTYVEFEREVMEGYTSF